MTSKVVKIRIWKYGRLFIVSPRRERTLEVCMMRIGTRKINKTDINFKRKLREDFKEISLYGLSFSFEPSIWASADFLALLFVFSTEFSMTFLIRFTHWAMTINSELSTFLQLSFLISVLSLFINNNSALSDLKDTEIQFNF